MQQNSFKSLVRGSWDATRGQRPRFFSFIALYIVAYTLDLLAPWAIGYTLGVFVKDGFDDEAFHRGTLGIIAYSALKLGNVLFHHLARYLQNTVAFQVRMNVLTDIFGQLLRFPLRWHLRSHSGENLSKLHRSAGAVEGMVGTYVWQVIEGAVKVVGAAACIIALDLRVALNVLLMSLVSIWIMIAFNRKLREKIRRNNRFANKVSSICVDYLFNVVTVKTLSLEKSAQKYLEAQRADGFRNASDIAKYTELKWSATSVGYALVIGTSLYIYFLGHRGFQGAFDVAEVYVLLNYLDRIFQAIGSFTAYYGGVIEASTSYEDAIMIHEESAKLLPSSVVSVPMRPTWKELRVRGLRFAYEAEETRGIHGIDLVIRRGEKVALVGPSGGGKSTVLKILGGLLAADEIQLSTDIEPQISQQQLSASCVLVPQEPEIFSETLLYNLTMDEPFREEEVTRVLSLCKLEEVLAKLPGGVHETLVEKGLNLSGGEKQRIALARALLRASSKPLVLLDEPTSSLDPATEKEIFHGLLTQYAERSVITACHRLALIPLFDRIVLIQQGRVVEQGSFQELLKKRGEFAKAWEDYERREARQVAAA